MQLPDMLHDEPLRRLSVDDVDRLLAAGVLASGDRVELLHGFLVERAMSDNEPHVWITQRLMETLVLATQGKAVSIVCQSSAKLGEFQLPSPDIAVVPMLKRGTRSVGGLLVIEVSDTTLRKDRVIKLPIYAVAKVPEYWIVDVNRECVHVHTDPQDQAYTSCVVVERGGVLRARELAGVEILVEDLFRQD